MDTGIAPLGGTIEYAPPVIGGVALFVRDLVAVEQFYRGVVGLERVDAASGRVLLGAGGTGLLELLHRPDALPRDPAAAGLFHTAFLLPQRAALGQWLAHAAGIGQGLDGAADHLVSEAVYLHDPEGNGVEIYVDRPAAEWRWTETPEGRRVVMANDRLDHLGLRALAMAPWTGAPAGTRIGHVHLQVGDVAAALPFYAGVLGMEVTAGRGAAAFLSTGGYHHHLAVNMWNSAGAGARDGRQAGLAAVRLVSSGAARRLVDPWGTVFEVGSVS